MTDRRQHILRLVHLALAHEGDERAEFLSTVCAGDDALRDEVESLVARSPPDDFLDASALNAVAVLPLGDTSEAPDRAADRES